MMARSRTHPRLTKLWCHAGRASPLSCAPRLPKCRRPSAPATKRSLGRGTGAQLETLLSIWGRADSHDSDGFHATYFDMLAGHDIADRLCVIAIEASRTHVPIALRGAAKDLAATAPTIGLDGFTRLVASAMPRATAGLLDQNTRDRKSVV